MSGVSALLRGTPESHHVRLGDKGRLRTRQHPPPPPAPAEGSCADASILGVPASRQASDKLLCLSLLLMGLRYSSPSRLRLMLWQPWIGSSQKGVD